MKRRPIPGGVFILSGRHCEERSDEAIQAVSAGRSLDCFAEPVIGPRFARTRWLAMTRIKRPLLHLRERREDAGPRADALLERSEVVLLVRRMDVVVVE